MPKVMASALLGKITSRVKGHHVYKSNCSVGDKCVCHPEPGKRHSKDWNAIIVTKTELRDSAPTVSKKRLKIPLLVTSPTSAQIICPLLKDGTITSMTGEVTGKQEKHQRARGFLEVELNYHVFTIFSGTRNTKHKWGKIRQTQSAVYGASSAAYLESDF